MSEKKQLGRPKGRTKEETLAKIMTAARHLFANKGYAQTTFKDIGKEIGISHAALYAYFDSKKDLYLASFFKTQELLLPHFIEAFTNGKDFRDRIKRVLLAVAQEHEKDSSITAFLVSVPIEIRRHEELHTALTSNESPVMGILDDIVEEAKAKGEIVIDVPSRKLIDAIIGGGIGVSLLQYGLHNPELTSTMDVFISLIQGKAFAPDTK